MTEAYTSNELTFTADDAKALMYDGLASFSCINDFEYAGDGRWINGDGTQWWADQYDIVHDSGSRTLYWIDLQDDGSLKTLHFTFLKTEDF